MLSALLSEITAAPTRTRQNVELETALEHHFSELVVQHRLLKAALLNLMELGQQTAVGATPDADAVIFDKITSEDGTILTCGVTLGMTYLATALILSGHAIESENAVVVLNVVECHLLSFASTAYNHLRGHNYALQRFGQLLNGYVNILDLRDPMNYQRKLFYLHQAAVSFSPSPEYLSVAHALLVREATRCRCPGPALAVMRQPILEVSPADTGAGLTCFHSYYCSGGLLLAAMQCWEDATVWLRSALCMSKNLQRKSALEAQAEVAVTTTATFSASPTTALSESGGIRDTLLRAAKAFILVSIISQGDLHNPADRRRAQRVMQQFRGGNADPYFRLLSAAAKRDGKLWDTLEKHFESLWKQEGMAELVAEAGLRLRRHVIRDMAKVANRVYLSDILSAFRTHFLLGMGDVDDAKEIPALIQTLLNMQEEGELLIRLENVHSGMMWEESMTMEEEGNDMGVKSLVARLELPPKRIPAVLGTRRLGCGLLSLSDIDIGKKQRYEQVQLRCAMEERIRRYESARAALMRATEEAGIENAQLAEDDSGR
ncbi:hypothetical protein C3747_57g126 [Trypanosoma cruzi]|uniref:COP9 signalosome complex subunit 3 N-terminal helical repeats domain-containing protein n=2 Tax=Trypanosoma cruzi TaxID=5693 RepID=Q4DDI2_TRYCC|nr:hypothetical protein, conserved [Trypanosoma cruzi]EAN90588.1 hypothetical protein, conserved [Trypanosoma cruzi]PWV11749.1 hypothetical protein C3747_57g126 [Trypanosoma cruzi]RNC57417.1 hypothetical protein TcCL_ESM04974 [Trypanosoma cruzi]|eukprot:XP_812439.1 hypothetical protein [Trypanosoma cruzi strain CL Brener]